MLVGLVYQRALLIVLLAAVPLATVLLFARPLLVLGGQTIEWHVIVCHQMVWW